MIFFGSNEERKSEDVPKIGHDPSRIVLRKLPADIDYDRFVDKIATLKGVKSYYFIQGRVPSDPNETPVHSRAYLQMESTEHSKSAVRQLRNSSRSVDFFPFASSDIQKALNESVPAPFIAGHRKSRTKLEESPLFLNYMKMAAGEITEEEFQKPYLAKPKRKKAPKQAHSPSAERRDEATEKKTDASKKKKEKKENLKKEKEKNTSAQQKQKKVKAKKSKSNKKTGGQNKSAQAEPSTKVQIT
ncbi:hypothetical protein KL918_002211 [Ogataea parapolymorpha]|uniref:Uncharacterized protein n=1 Tax=Ogataea parapolymorpha (strain ATCC 26012 / BCRC 20466 / JCM 22074 / NRRL Y-7560 / DL-1) TaxID=871575 RepID=W1QL17_OGAPD|nr:hypothetical protein HPODL_02324 [Ogataea parapolymorpha DL-1]ESX03016.1 hypothetical protein HPODL_02324 [Ogataea parapolymorpha DL-1]KAG7867614.1 hypothetical protein KL918_002211 [Ogataea parapolymorpha]KAG7871676.1 hypothetical protein KL916_003776 [Ogataea parapolymorpha]